MKRPILLRSVPSEAYCNLGSGVSVALAGEHTDDGILVYIRTK